MTEPTTRRASRWRDVKAKAQAADPTWDAADRQARRAQLRQEMLASVSGAQLAEIRKQLGLTQTQLAEATGLENLRAYVTGLGGHLDIVARIGNIHLNVA
jgi:hypothetical protein